MTTVFASQQARILSPSGPCLLLVLLRSFPSLHYLVDHYYIKLRTALTADQPKAPPPLQIPPSRARRQFALRLAQRKAQLEATQEQEDDPEPTQEQEEREGHQRFARMFEGIDDSSDDESINSYEGAGIDDDDDHVAGPIEVEGKEVGKSETKKEENTQS